ncbi:MAG: HEPN domain-containing protein [Anaerolineaceae bacterium]|nr:HEPN domain-containing protein [Anaerolineaceae bacterium]
MTCRNELEFSKLNAYQLAHDILDLVKVNRPNEWSIDTIRMGDQYNYWDLRDQNSFQQFKEGLLQNEEIRNKFDEENLEAAIRTLIDAVFGNVKNGIILERDFDKVWEKFCQFISADDVIIRTVIGLANFQAERDEYSLNENIKVVSFKKGRLTRAISHFVDYWDWDHLEREIAYAHSNRCTGAVIFDIKVSLKDYLRNIGDLIGKRIGEKLRITTALRLAGFGRLMIDPWISICNPPFPFQGILPVGESEYIPFSNDPYFLLTDESMQRFLKAYDFLNQIRIFDEEKAENNRNTFNRIQRAIRFFLQTFDQGIWGTAVADLVIGLETIYLSDVQGGWLNTALAASNLLGTNEAESREIFENIYAGYQIRNMYVHGDAIPEKAWIKYLSRTAASLNIPESTDPGDVGFAAIEILRDYLRHSIMASLALFCSHKTSLNKDLYGQLIRLHLNTPEHRRLQQYAGCYSFSERNKSFVSLEDSEIDP